MIADKELFLAEKKAVLGVAVTGAIIDQKSAGDCGEYMSIVNKIDADFAGGTSLQVCIETADNEALASSLILPVCAIYPAADLKVGNSLAMPLPKGLKRYWRVKYVPSGTFTAGEVSSYVVLEADNV